MKVQDSIELIFIYFEVSSDTLLEWREPLHVSTHANDYWLEVILLFELYYIDYLKRIYAGDWHTRLKPKLFAIAHKTRNEKRLNGLIYGDVILNDDML